MFVYHSDAHFKGSNLLPRILSPVFRRTLGILCWLFDPSVINIVQTFKAYYYWAGYWFLFSWGDLCGVTCGVVSHSIVGRINERYDGGAVAGFSFSTRHFPRGSALSVTPEGRSVLHSRIDAPPTPVHAQNTVSGNRCGPCTSHMPTRVQLAHTNM